MLSQLDTRSSLAFVGFGLNVSDDTGSFGDPVKLYSGKAAMVVGRQVNHF